MLYFKSYLFLPGNGIVGVSFQSSFNFSRLITCLYETSFTQNTLYLLKSKKICPRYLSWNIGQNFILLPVSSTLQFVKKNDVIMWTINLLKKIKWNVNFEKLYLCHELSGWYQKERDYFKIALLATILQSQSIMWFTIGITSSMIPQSCQFLFFYV